MAARNASDPLHVAHTQVVYPGNARTTNKIYHLGENTCHIQFSKPKWEDREELDERGWRVCDHCIDAPVQGRPRGIALSTLLEECVDPDELGPGKTVSRKEKQSVYEQQRGGE